MFILLFAFSFVQGQYTKVTEALKTLQTVSSHPTCNAMLALTNYNKEPGPGVGKGHECRFQIDLNELCHVKFLSLDCTVERVQALQRCWVEHILVCDGFSQCLTDECGCGDDVFRCADKVGCIAKENLCDGFEDCRDGSDECMCDDVVTCHIDQRKYCVPRDKYCRSRIVMYSQRCEVAGKVDCTDIKADEIGFLKFVSLDHKMTICWAMFEMTDLVLSFTRETFKTWCKLNCDALYTQFCEKITFTSFQIQGFGGYEPFFQCDGTDEKVGLNMVCDGKNDCKTGGDESKCPNRYYCTVGHSWVDSKQVCDGRTDCPDGLDECQGCRDEDLLSSDDKMIRYLSLQILICVEAVLILVLNVIAGYRAQSKPDRVDRFILLSLCFYDALMGVYLACLFVKSVLFSGLYCTGEYVWRSGLECKLLGVLFTFSAHGSLLMVFVKTVSLATNMSLTLTILIALLLSVFNALHSIVPILPISTVQDMFRANMTFSDNPFMQDYNASELVRKYEVYFGKSNPPSKVPDTYTMLDHLNKVSTGGAMFEVEELGYYASSFLCVNNMYETQLSLMSYRIGYLACIAAVIFTASIMFFRATSLFKQLLLCQNEPAEDARITPMATLMIWSQLLCWVCVMVLMVVHTAQIRSDSRRLLYATTVIMVLPLKCLINPAMNILSSTEEQVVEEAVIIEQNDIVAETELT